MKNNLILLLKTSIINSFKLKSTSKKKKVLIAFFALYIVGTLVITFGVFLNHLFSVLNTNGLTNYFIPLLFGIASLFSFFFTIYSAKAGLFENKDNDLLLSLPIKRSTILLNRIIYITIYNFIIGLVFIIPGIYIYLINVSVNVMFYLSIILLVIFMPVIPTILASLFGYLIAYLTSKTRSKNMFELLYYVLFIFVYIYAMNNANNLLLKLTNNPVLLNKIIKYLFFPFYLINIGITTNNVFYTIAFVGLNILCLLLFVVVLNKSYFKILSKLTAQKVKSNFKMKVLVGKSMRKALREKETKRYFSSAIYVFNTAFGVVFIAILGIVSLFYSQDKLLSLVNNGTEMSFTPFNLVLIIVLFVIAMTNTTACAISIEKNNFWIMKTIPVKVKEIFNAKLFVNKIVLLPVTIISLFLFKISGYIDYTQLLLLIIITVFYNSFIANFGLIINLLFPKFDALNDTIIVKQSISSMIGILVPFFLTMIIIVLINTSTIPSMDILCLLIALSVFLALITKLVLNKWGTKRFYQIS